MTVKMTYAELIEKLQAAEKATGLYLSDVCVDAENGDINDDASMFRVAADAAADRARDAGLDINKILGFVVF